MCSPVVKTLRDLLPKFDEQISAILSELVNYILKQKACQYMSQSDKHLMKQPASRQYQRQSTLFTSEYVTITNDLVIQSDAAHSYLAVCVVPVSKRCHAKMFKAAAGGRYEGMDALGFSH
jgi:hypothetical protein